MSQFNALLEATPDCLIISNKEGQIVFANKMMENRLSRGLMRLATQQRHCDP